MPIPEYAGPRTYFIFAEVEPKEVMNFGVEAGIQLDRDATLETLGHALAFWLPSATEQDFDELRGLAQDVFDVTLAIDAALRLETGEKRRAVARRASIHSWLEVRGYEARENVIGTVHGRYPLANIEMDGQAADDFKTAAKAAWSLVARPNARLALKDFGLSLAESGEDAFLFAYRSMENVRRCYAKDKPKSGGGFEANWQPMHDALGTSEDALRPLTDAATTIRHGQSEGSSPTREAREKTLELADDVLRRFLRHEKLVP